MRNAIILHGAPSKKEYYDFKYPSMSNSHWIPWLQGQLLKHDIAASTPEVPWSFDRNWSLWKKEVERYDMTPKTVLVGHSTGAGFFVKYLSICPNLKVDKVILVAPWLDPDRKSTVNFFDDFEIDPDLGSRTQGITILSSDNDEIGVLKTVKILQKTIKGIKTNIFHDYGHFCYEDMKKYEFLELLDLIIAGVKKDTEV